MGGRRSDQDAAAIPGLGAVLQQLQRLQGDEFRSVQTWKTLLNYVVEVAPVRGGESLFVKLPRANENLREEYVRTQRLGAVLPAGSPLKCVEAVSYFERPPALVVRKVAGDSFRKVLEETCHWSVRPFDPDRRALSSGQWVGRWLRAVGERTVGIASTDDVRLALGTAVGNARRVLSTRGRVGSRVSRVVEECVTVLESPPGDLPVTLAHRDFHPANVFVALRPEPTVTVIDCRLSAPRFAGYDSVLLDYHLSVNLVPWRFDRRRVGRVMSAVGDEAASQVEPGAPRARFAAAEIVLGGLTYLDTRDDNASTRRRMTRAVDHRRIERWAQKWMRG